MLTKIERLEIHVGELVKENHELREAGEKLAKENIDKYFAIKKHAECNYKLTKENQALKKELKELKKDSPVHICNGGKKLTEMSFGGDLIFEEVKIELKPNQWYHTKDFTEEELQKLLPIGTTVLVEKEVLYDNIATTPPTETEKSTVESITTSNFIEETLIEPADGDFLKDWFKIVKEN